ncbi:MAG TPA: peptidoglycan-binding protein [Stenomitos sp.]
MNRQIQWLFEVPSSLENPRYSNFEFNEEYAESPVLEALWETEVVVLQSDRFRDDQRLQAAASNRPPMRIGERGSAVQKLQQALIDLGFPMPISTQRSGKPDGAYGNETATTVTKFQSMHGLQVDGIAGQQTLTKLDQLLTKSPVIPGQYIPPTKSCTTLSHLEDTGLMFRRILGEDVTAFPSEKVADLLTYAVGLPKSAAPTVQVQPGNLQGLISVLNTLSDRVQVVGEQCSIPREEIDNIKKRIDGLRAFYQGQVDGSQPQVNLKRQIMVSIAVAEIGKVKAAQTEVVSSAMGGCRKRFGWQRLEKYFEVAYGDRQRWNLQSVQCFGVKGLPAWCGIFTLWAIKSAGVNICNWGGGISRQIRRQRAPNESPLPGDIAYLHKNQHHCMVVLVHSDRSVVTVDGNSWMGGVQLTSRPRGSIAAFFDVDTALPLCTGLSGSKCPQSPKFDCPGGTTGQQTSPPGQTGSATSLVYEEKVPENRAEFVDKVRAISAQLGINPDWLMALMNHESGLNHRAQNPYAKATGLIQFMPSTAKRLGTTIEALQAMTNVEQLDYVIKYFMPFRGRLRSYSDLYLATFYPYAMGKPDSYVFGSERSDAWARKVREQNRGMDWNKDGYITLAEFKAWIYRGIPDHIKSRLS